MIRLEVTNSNLGDAIDVVGRHTGKHTKGGKRKRREGKETHTCKWTGVNLNVIKSHMGQYMMPLVSVGSKSRFNRATISVVFSPALVIQETT